MLVSEVMVISRLKILNGISMKFIECLNKDVKKKKKKKKKRTLYVHLGVGLFKSLPAPIA